MRKTLPKCFQGGTAAPSAAHRLKTRAMCPWWCRLPESLFHIVKRCETALGAPENFLKQGFCQAGFCTSPLPHEAMCKISPCIIALKSRGDVQGRCSPSSQFVELLNIYIFYLILYYYFSWASGLGFRAQLNNILVILYFLFTYFIKNYIIYIFAVPSRRSWEYTVVYRGWWWAIKLTDRGEEVRQHE